MLQWALKGFGWWEALSWPVVFFGWWGCCLGISVGKNGFWLPYSWGGVELFFAWVGYEVRLRMPPASVAICASYWWLLSLDFLAVGGHVEVARIGTEILALGETVLRRSFDVGSKREWMETRLVRVMPSSC